MGDRVVVLEDVAFRVDGLRILERVTSERDDVILDLAALSLAEGLWTLPALDAIAATLPAARLFVRADDDLSQLVVAHLRAQRHQVVSHPAHARSPAAALRIELSPRRTTRPRLSANRDHLLVPSRAFPQRKQHTWGHWVDGARACGFDARAARPLLQLRDGEKARVARRWLRERFGFRGRTVIALLPARDAADGGSWGLERFAELGTALSTRLDVGLISYSAGGADGAGGAGIPGAFPIDDLDVLTAAYVLSCAAVAIGDAGSRVHLAAAAGAPAISLHEDANAEERGAVSALGAAISGEYWQIPVSRVSDVAEELAGRRWPWDRLAQAGLVRPSS